MRKKYISKTQRSQLNKMAAGIVQDPTWILERRQSSGQLVWCKDTPRSKVRFLYDVEVLEYEKHPLEDGDHIKDGYFMNSIALCATCFAALAVSVFLPWLLIEKVGSI